MDYVQKTISYLHIWAGARTAEDFYLLGTIIGSLIALIGLVAWIKRKYLQKNGRKLASEFIVLNVAFFGFLLTITDFLITQGTAFAGLLPFVNVHWAQISAGAIAVHAVATALHKWWKDRKDGVPLTADNLIDGIVDIKTATLPTGVEKVKQPIPQINADVWANE